MVEGSQRRIFQIWPFSTLPNWSSMMFIESHFLRYPTCLIFAQVVLVVEKSAVQFSVQFFFGTEVVMTQMIAKGVVGGGLGRH